jgi:hypothetical protein
MTSASIARYPERCFWMMSAVGRACCGPHGSHRLLRCTSRIGSVTTASSKSRRALVVQSSPYAQRPRASFLRDFKRIWVQHRRRGEDESETDRCAGGLTSGYRTVETQVPRPATAAHCASAGDGQGPPKPGQGGGRPWQRAAVHLARIPSSVVASWTGIKQVMQ